MLETERHNEKTRRHDHLIQCGISISCNYKSYRFEFSHVVSYVEIMSFCVLSSSVDEINNVNHAISEWTKLRDGAHSAPYNST